MAQAQKAQDETAIEEVKAVLNKNPGLKKGERGAVRPKPVADKVKSSPKETPTVAGDSDPELKKGDPVTAKPAPIPRPAKKAFDMNPFLAVVILAGFAMLLVAFTYCAPVLSVVSAMPQGLIGLLIIFWGLQQAWHLTQKTSLDFKGPFRVGDRGPSEPGVSAHA